jgi:hypothetical protein
MPHADIEWANLATAGCCSLLIIRRFWYYFILHRKKIHQSAHAKSPVNSTNIQNKLSCISSIIISQIFYIITCWLLIKHRKDLYLIVPKDWLLQFHNLHNKGYCSLLLTQYRILQFILQFIMQDISAH